MSQENVEVVRGIYDAVARRDTVTSFEVYAEDIVWDISNWRAAGLMEKGVYRGHGGVRQFWRESLSVFSEIDLEVQELIAAGDRVLAVIREREVGRGSGVPVENTHVAVWTLADGKVSQLQTFDDRQQALEAAGLSECAMSQENVEAVRQICRAMGEGDVERALTYWDEHCDYYPVQKFPEAQPCHGPEDIRRFFVEIFPGVDQVEYTIDTPIPLGDDRALVRLEVSFEGKRSGLKLGGELFHCYWLRHGRVFRQEDHLTLPSALRALGLEGESLESAGLSA